MGSSLSPLDVIVFRATTKYSLGCFGGSPVPLHYKTPTVPSVFRSWQDDNLLLVPAGSEQDQIMTVQTHGSVLIALVKQISHQTMKLRFQWGDPLMKKSHN